MREGDSLLHVDLDIASTEIKSNALRRSMFIDNTVDCGHERELLCHVSSRQEMIDFLRCSSTLELLTVQHFLFNFFDALARFDKGGSYLSVTTTSTGGNEISNTTRFYIECLSNSARS